MPFAFNPHHYALSQHKYPAIRCTVYMVTAARQFTHAKEAMHIDYVINLYTRSISR